MSQFWIGNARFDCDNTVDSIDNCLDTNLFVVGFVFDIFSIIGSLFIIMSYVAFPDLRTRARLFLTFIAVCDLFHSISIGFSLIWSMKDPKFSACYNGKSYTSIWACIIQATISVYFPLTSFFWTLILGIHIVLLIKNKLYFKSKSIFLILLVVGWGLPLVDTALAFFLNLLGPGPPTSSAGWCFVSYKNSSYYPINTNGKYYHFITELVVAKFWDVLVTLLLIILYIVAFSIICRTRVNSNIYRNIPDFKLLLIPLVFVFIRIWGDIRFILAIIYPQISTRCNDTIYIVLGYLQVIFEPGQGWANALLYLLLTKSIRKRIVHIVKDSKAFKMMIGFRKNPENNTLIDKKIQSYP